jgi:hypothetical protein
MKKQTSKKEKNNHSIKTDVSLSFNELTALAKSTPLGQKIMQEMKPMEMWVNDISPDGKIIGRLEMMSSRYEKNCG